MRLLALCTLALFGFGCQTIVPKSDATVHVSTAEQDFCSAIKPAITNIENYFLSHQNVVVKVELKYCTFVPFSTTQGYGLFRAVRSTVPAEAQDLALFFRLQGSEWVPIDVKVISSITVDDSNTQKTPNNTNKLDGVKQL